MAFGSSTFNARNSIIKSADISSAAYGFVEPLDTNISFGCPPLTSLALLLCCCILFVASISLSPLVRFLQGPSHAGPSTVWGVRSEIPNDSWAEGSSLGPRAPVQPLGVVVFIILFLAVLTLCITAIYEITFEKKALEWFEVNYRERGTRLVPLSNARSLGHTLSMNVSHMLRDSSVDDIWDRHDRLSSQAIVPGLPKFSALGNSLMRRQRHTLQRPGSQTARNSSSGAIQRHSVPV
eukprot:Gregarina_sp_Poly_1__5862@NODE_308_length_9647_cov_165_896660_g265_i0_p5_GENE_NODE_308_length_9647_cov_165_896660_g265_i0NODE_308_length_9647_cov_165_896660_g265_i0_p5_ORF_typecomplete_len237_score16_40MCLC/PF05934_11/5_6e03MCLC/PF05934_11/0_17_NODE_308_length_9647_cov_165_896660_g265_i054646174